MSKNNKNKTERYLMSLTKQRLVGILMHDNTKLELLESNKNKDQRIAELKKENAELQKQLLETQSNFFIARKFILNKYSSLLTVESYKKILDKLY